MREPAIGSTVAGYRLDALIARGGMGVVYRATQLALDRPVALKVIARHLSQDDGFRSRFLRECRLAASLDHPNVVTVFDSREEDDELIVAMRLVEGGDLKRRLAKGGPLPPSQAVELLGQVAEALDAAHAAGIVHRDVKPHNILLEGDHRAYLSDFGLAKALGDSGVLSGTSIVGTVEYMSPEQWRGETVGPAADVYSLGCVLYEALTGIVPYARRAGDAEPEMPEGLDDVIERAVSKDPAERYPSAGALIAAARQHQGAAPAATKVLSETPDRPTLPLGRRGGWLGRVKALPRRWLLAPVGLAALVALLFVLFSGGEGVSVSAPIPIGRGPLRIAAGDGSIWVTSQPNGTLSRIDPATLKVVGEPLHLGAGISGVAVGGDSVWVGSLRAGRVWRIDPSTGRVLAKIAVGGRPGAIAIGGGRVWIADEAGSGVTMIGAARGRVVKRGIVPLDAPLRLAVGASALWVSSASTNSLWRIDLGNAVASAPIPVGPGPAGVAVGEGIVWVANSRGGSVSRLDPSTREIVGDPIAVGGRPGGVDTGTSAVWVAIASEDTVVRIDMATGEPIGDPIPVGRSPGAVTVGEEAVWVANNGDGTITRIEP